MKHSKISERKIDVFIDKSLPHGSGIDAKWEVSENKNFIMFHNSFHCMDESGYVGWQDFTIKVSWVVFESEQHKNVADNFILQFNGRQYLAQKHQLRDYLEDTIYYSITM